jgi:hypothetical protein
LIDKVSPFFRIEGRQEFRENVQECEFFICLPMGTLCECRSGGLHTAFLTFLFKGACSLQAASIPWSGHREKPKKIALGA